MSGLLYTVVAFVVAISVLVVVHEFGHYWVARRMGVKVLRFSVGFGKLLWLRRFGRDQTEWVIAAIPLGGYVKMLGEHDDEVPAAELPRAFHRQPIWKRSAIVIAGPLFNFLFAIVAYAGLNMVGIDGIRPLVGKVVDGSPAAQAGFRPGDEWVSIDDRPVRSWDEHRLYLYEKAIDRATVHFVVRDASGVPQERLLNLGSLTTAEVGAALLERDIGLTPALPEIPPVVGTLEAGGPAERVGIMIGDRVVAIDGQPVTRWAELVEYVSARPDTTLRVEIERAGARHTITVTARAHERGGQRIGRIGIGVQLPALPESMRVTVRRGPVEALAAGVATTWHMSALTLKMLGKMLMLEVSTKTISGPLTIAQYAGASAQMGFDRFVLFLAVVSISLGVLNLLPIPVLDGGHLLFNLVEAIWRRPVPEAVQHWGQQLGILLLVALMMLAFYNDFMRLLE